MGTKTGISNRYPGDADAVCLDHTGRTAGPPCNCLPAYCPVCCGLNRSIISPTSRTHLSYLLVRLVAHPCTPDPLLVWPLIGRMPTAPCLTSGSRPLSWLGSCFIQGFPLTSILAGPTLCPVARLVGNSPQDSSLLPPPGSQDTDWVHGKLTFSSLSAPPLILHSSWGDKTNSSQKALNIFFCKALDQQTQISQLIPETIHKRPIWGCEGLLILSCSVWLCSQAVNDLPKQAKPR